MHSIQYRSDAQLNARLRDKTRHAEPIPPATKYRLHRMRLFRIQRNWKECVYGRDPHYGVIL